MKILLVEDSQVIRERLRTLISEISGAELVAEVDGQDEAVRDILVLRPDVVVLDLKLANGSGMEVLRMVKAQLPIVIVIVLTNYGYPQYRKKCLELGADHFMDKSKDVGSLGKVLVGISEQILLNK